MSKHTLALAGTLAGFSVFLGSCVETLPKPPLTANETPAPNYSTPKNAEAKVNIEQVSVFASTAIDVECKQMVVTTSAEENLAGMAKFSAELAKVTLMGMAGDAIKGSSSNATNLNADAVKKLLWYYSKNYVWLPMSAERLYGDKQHEEEWGASGYLLPRDKKNAKVYANADDLLKKALDAVGESYDYTFEVFVHKKPSTKAMALPGGKVYIYQGLLKYELQQLGKKKENKLSKEKREQAQLMQDHALFILSHEISHILQRHETKHIQTRLMDSVDLADMVQKVNAVRSGDNVGVIIGGLLTGKQLFTKNHIDQEMQADSCGVKLATKVMNGDKHRLRKVLSEFIAGLEKHGATDKGQLTKVSKRSELQGGGMEPLASQGLYRLVEQVSSPIEQHPNTRERENNLNLMLNRL